MIIYGLAFMALFCGGLFAVGLAGRVTGEAGSIICRWIIKKQKEERTR